MPRGTFLLGTGASAEAQAEFPRAVDIGTPIFREGALLLKDKLNSLPFEPRLQDDVAGQSPQLATSRRWRRRVHKAALGAGGNTNVTDAQLLCKYADRLRGFHDV